MLNEFFDKLLDPWVLIFILSVEWGVRGIEDSLCIVFNIIELIIIYFIEQVRFHFKCFSFLSSHPRKIENILPIFSFWHFMQ